MHGPRKLDVVVRQDVGVREPQRHRGSDASSGRVISIPRITKGLHPVATVVRRVVDAARAAKSPVRVRDSALGRPLSTETRRATNAALLRVERSFTRPEGLRTRPWYRNLIYAADENNGYANMVFPSVNEAVRTGDAALTQREIDDLARRFDAASSALDDSARILRR